MSKVVGGSEKVVIGMNSCTREQQSLGQKMQKEAHTNSCRIVVFEQVGRTRIQHADLDMGELEKSGENSTC